MKSTFITILLLVFNMTIGAFAQGPSSKVDSLKAELSRLPEDSSMVFTLIELAKANDGGTPELMLEYSQKAYILSEKIGFQKGKALSDKWTGTYYFFHDKYGEGAKYWERSLQEYTAIQDVDGMVNLLSNLGVLNSNKGSQERALRYLSSAIELEEKIGDKSRLSSALLNVGFCYMNDHSNYDKAMSNFRKALKIGMEIQDTAAMGLALMNIGEVFMALQQDSNALANFMKAKELYQATDDDDLVYTLNKIGKVFQKRKSYDSARMYHELALDKATKNRDELFMAESELELAEVLRLTHQFDMAQQHFRKASTLAAKVGALAEQFRSYDGLATVYGQQADFRNAYQNQQYATKIADSLYRMNRDKHRIEVEAEMKESDIKALQLDQEKKILEIRNNKNRTNFLIGLIGLLIVGAILAANNIQRKRSNVQLQNQKMEIEKALVDLKAAQTQLIQSEKMASLGELTAGIAHEIQNPLNFVNNFSDLNLELIIEAGEALAKGDVPETKSILGDMRSNEEKIRQHGRRADAIVKGMLQHAKISKGQKEATDINSLCDEYMRLSYHGFRAKDKSFAAVLEAHYDPSLTKVNIVPQDISRVLLNIFNNAFYSISEKARSSHENYGGTVSVNTGKVNGNMEIRIRDNGMGIPDKVKEKIFQPFFTTKPTGQGTGLGLSLSYDIIKAHQGSIHMNTREGEYTEFVIQLPA